MGYMMAMSACYGCGKPVQLPPGFCGSSGNEAIIEAATSSASRPQAWLAHPAYQGWSHASSACVSTDGHIAMPAYAWMAEQAEPAYACLRIDGRASHACVRMGTA